MRSTLAAIAVALLLPAGAAAQYRTPSLPPDAGTYQPVFRGHADGGEVPVAIGLATLTGLTSYDVATAGSSTRTFNAANPDRAPRSPGAAPGLSAGATVAPFASGLLVFDQGLRGTGVSSAGLVLSMTALAVGPTRDTGRPGTGGARSETPGSGRRCWSGRWRWNSAAPDGSIGAGDPPPGIATTRHARDALPRSRSASGVFPHV